MYLLAIFLFLLPSFLFADPNLTDTDEQNSSLTLYGIPSGVFFGVDVINGEYQYSCTDFSLPGVNPLIYQRSYNGTPRHDKFQSTITNNFFDGWTNNLFGVAHARKGDLAMHVSIFSSFGSKTPCEGSKYISNDKLTIKPEFKVRGITNCSTGLISGCTNLKNKHPHYTPNEIRVEKGDGTIDYFNYSHKSNKRDYYHLSKSLKPNGLVTLYKMETVSHLDASWNKSKTHILKEIQTLTNHGKIANQIIFSSPIGSKKEIEKKNFIPAFHIEGMSKDAKKATYFYEYCFLKKFESNYLPWECYSYYGNNLSERFGSRHKTCVSFYKEDDYVKIFDKKTEKITHKHKANHRVKSIKVAVNNLEDMRTVAKFAYYESENSPYEAFTDVYDEHNFLTRYHYSPYYLRLNCIEKFSGKDSKRSVYCREKLYFGSKDTLREADLLFRTVEDAEGTIYFGENYEYDERGNVLAKSLHFRQFKNLFSTPIFRDKESSFENERLNGGEIKSTHYTYNLLNRPLSEDDGRLKKLMTYHSREEKETSLLKSKLYLNGQNIVKREFREYDLNAACTLKIIDDGVSSSSNDLKGMNFRQIVRFKNLEEDFAGLPLEMDIFGSDGKQEKRVSRVKYEYDKHGYVTKETYFDAENKYAFEISKLRDMRGNILCETDAMGQTTNRLYDEYGNLLVVQGPSPDRSLHYTYDCLQRPIIETLQCSDGVELTNYKYYDLEGRLIGSQNPYGAKTEITYNEQGKPVEIISPAIRTDKGEWQSPRTSKHYNFLGYLISEIDANGAMTICTPNDAGLPLSIQYPDGTFEHFAYSIYGEILEKKQRNGSKVAYIYDEFSRPISEKIYDEKGHLLKETKKKYSGLLLLSEKDAEGVKTKYTYDYAGRVCEVKKGNSLTKSFYDSLGRVAEERRYFGKGDKDYVAIQYTYNLLGKIIEQREIDESGQQYSKTQFCYNADGNIISKIEWTPEGIAKTTNTYDPRGQLSSTTDALGSTTYFHHRYDFFFEGQNLPYLETTDPQGVKTVVVSDHSNHEIFRKTFSPNGDLLSHIEFFYDLQGNLVRKEFILPEQTIITLMTYDSCGRLINQIDGAGTEEQFSTSFKYNSKGELSRIQYSDGTSKRKKYDAIGRLSEELSGDKSIHYRYTYNRHDQPTIIKNCNTKKQTIREYSREGYLLSECLENGLKMTYTYDYFGRLTKCIYPDGSSVKQTYNPVSMQKVKRTDQNGKTLYETCFSYYESTHKPKQIILPKKSGTLDFTYDRMSRVRSLSFNCYKEEKIKYDSVGQQISKRVNKDLQHYEHDYLQQLTLEKTSNYTHQYENDALNRQISVDGCKQTFNSIHQLTRGVEGKYKYDEKGRRIQDANANYKYDKFDRLIAIKKGELTYKYTYDAFNRKMSRTFNGETTYYLYNGYEEIGSYSEDKVCLDLKILSGKEGTFPIAIEMGEQKYTPIISSQGHIVGLIDMESGDLADLSPLTLFGKDLSKQPLSPWRFCRKRHEERGLGLIDFGFRFYDPKASQWLTRDPLGEADGPNLYAYVRNNPGSYIDLYGLKAAGYAYLDSIDASFKLAGYPCDYRDRGIDLPSVIYDDNFEERHKDLIIDGKIIVKDYYDFSCSYQYYDSSLSSLPPGIGVYYINGMCNNYDDALDNTRYASKLSGYCLNFIYNATHGIGVDFKESIMGKLGIATPPVRVLQKVCENFFNNNDEKARLLIICHSQGAIHTKNALLACPEELWNRICVLGIAPANYPYKETCADIALYGSEGDFVHRLDREGLKRSKDSFRELKRHPDASWWDHSFQSPTFRDVLKNQIQHFVNNGGLQ